MFISIITITVFMVFICVAIYYGGLRRVRIYKKESRDFYLVFNIHKGDYKDINNVIDRVAKDLVNNNIKDFKRFGIYLDDPLYVEKDDLKSIGGCIVEKNDDKNFSNFENLGLKTYELTKRDAICTNFPLYGNFSIILALLKVYPKLTKYFEKSKIDIKAIMEVYDILDRRIDYYCFKNFDTQYFESLFK